ncbi:MAG: 4Fe-4S binding protein [Bacillota bacterium]
MSTLTATEKNRRLQPIVGITLVLLMIGGWFYPPLGYFLLFCMVMAMGIGAVKGRNWCDWMCPRGSFWDSYLSCFSRNVEVPRFFRSVPFRLLWLAILMTMLIINIAPVWGDYYKMGKPFVMILTVTTAVGLVLGVAYHHRIWCMFCPMGTMANWLGRKKCPSPLMINAPAAGAVKKYAECRLTRGYTRKPAPSAMEIV